MKTTLEVLRTVVPILSLYIVFFLLEILLENSRTMWIVLPTVILTIITYVMLNIYFNMWCNSGIKYYKKQAKKLKKQRKHKTDIKNSHINTITK